jgi:Uma2 family endonuclease
MTVDEYLHTSFPDLDKEYRDGEVVERTLPDYLHAKTQGLLAAFFFAFRKTLRLYAAPEVRLKLQHNHYLIPDISVFHPNEPSERVPCSPPFVVIEILSPDDRLTAVREKLQEYRQWGVPHVWLVDPHSRRLYTCEEGLVEVATLRISELRLEVTPGDIFE